MTRRRYIVATVIVASAFAAAFVATAMVDPLPRVIWNASASAPIGLYRIHPDRDPPTGALVAIAPPKRLSRWLSARGYLPAGVPLLKHVAAKAGQTVCRIDDAVSVDGRPVAVARVRDTRDRPLPVWRGCRTLEPGEMFLLNPSVPESLDSRYFGPLPASTIIGRATPLHLRAPTQPASPPSKEEIGHADEYL